MVVKVVSFADRKTKQHNWTNEELAELYRVEHALVQAGIALETVSGISDEGDPWFAFCRCQGEVLVHIARYDGLYRLYSPALREPLVGPTFSALTKSFISGLRTPVQQSGIVSIHPAALLSVIVAAIFYTFDFHSNPARAAKEAPDSGHEGKHLHLVLDPPTSDALNHTLLGSLAAFCSRSTSEAVSLILMKVESAAILVASTIAALADHWHSDLTVSAADGSATIPGGGHQDQSTPDASSAREQDHEKAHTSALSKQAPTASDDSSGFSLDNTKADVAIDKGTASNPDSNQVQFSNFVYNTDAPSVQPDGSASTVADTSALAAGIGVGAQDNSTANGSPGIVRGHEADSTDGGPPSTINVTLADGETAFVLGVAQNIETVNVNLTGGGGTIDLTGASGVSTITVAGDGSLLISGVWSAGSVEVAVAPHYDVSLIFGVWFTDAAPLIKLLGQDQLSLADAPTTSLTLDSEGNGVNKVTIADTAVSAGAALDLTVVGTQDLMLQESSAAFNNTQFHTSTYTGSLTIGLDLQNTPQLIDLSKVDAASYVVGDDGNIASVNAANGAHIELGSGLDVVDVSVDGASASAPGSLSFEMGGGLGQPAPGFVTALEVLLTSDVVLNSSGAGAGVNRIATLIDPALSSLTLTGNFALAIGAIEGPAATDNQAITIDAHALTGALDLNVSDVADTTSGGRSIVIIGGSGSTDLTNLTATESTSFILGPGENTINIGAGSVSDSINGLTASAAVNIGSAGCTDTIVDEFNAGTSQIMIDGQTSLIAAAQAASALGGSSIVHQALLFTYQGVEYAFIDASGNHVFDPAHDAIIKLIGISTTANVAGAFHSA